MAPKMKNMKNQNCIEVKRKEKMKDKKNKSKEVRIKRKEHKRKRMNERLPQKVMMRGNNMEQVILNGWIKMIKRAKISKIKRMTRNCQKF